MIKFVQVSYCKIGCCPYTGPHQITGNGVGFKPDILDMDVMEKVLEVSICICITFCDIEIQLESLVFILTATNLCCCRLAVKMQLTWLEHWP